MYQIEQNIIDRIKLIMSSKNIMIDVGSSIDFKSTDVKLLKNKAKIFVRFGRVTPINELKNLLRFQQELYISIIMFSYNDIDGVKFRTEYSNLLEALIGGLQGFVPAEKYSKLSLIEVTPPISSDNKIGVHIKYDTKSLIELFTP